MSDGLLLLAGLVLLYLPGTAALVCLRVRSPRVVLGAAPVGTIAVLQLVALLRWGLGTGLAKTTAAAVAVLVVAAVVLEVRAGRDGVCRGAARAVGTAVRRRPAVAVATAAVLATGVGLGASSWLRGFGGLATPPQEHDTVTHTLVTAWIAHTGRAGPFEVLPTDLATGGHVNFYPAGLHTVAGLLSMLSGNPVSGFNATTVLVVALAGPLTLFAAAAAFEPVRTRPAFSALAGLLSVTLYRPYAELAHDAGIMAYAMGLALLPALAVALSGVRSAPGAVAARSGVALALVAFGLYTVHPSLVVIAVATAAVVAVVGALSAARFRAWVREHVRALLVGAVAACVLVAPWLVASLSVAGAVAGYPEAPPSRPLADVLLSVVRFDDIATIVTHPATSQLGFAALFWLGLLGCLVRRRLWPVAAAWLFWAGAAALFASGHAGLPGLAQLGSVFYNSWTRLTAVSWLLAPAVAGTGLAALVDVLVERAGDRLDAVRPLRRLQPAALLAPVAAVLVAAVYTAACGLAYAGVNQDAVAERYGDPQFLRLSPIEPQAFDYLAAHRSQVGRVLNNGNDGSTFLYVYDGIPVVNTYPEGMPQSEYGIYLMQHFDEIATNPAVRCLVQRYQITHVVTSVSSPRLPGAGFPEHWVTTEWFDYAPGFADLQQVPLVSRVFSNPDVSVYRIAPSVLAGHDLDACTGDPAHPLTGAPASASGKASG